MNTFRCVTNNPLLRQKGFAALEYYDVDVLTLFQMTAREVAKGYQLLTHPLTGSVRPDITPYKTVLLSAVAGRVDAWSAHLMEEAVRYAQDLYRLREEPLFQRWGPQAKEDFQLIDCSIIERALEVAQWDR